jgi:putative RNA 2'-phosphotransferase
MKNAKEQSKFLSLVLRHDPGKIGITLDPQGWVPVQEFLAALPFKLDRKALEELVRDNDKQRFALSPDGQKIRANQGHSLEVDLALDPQIPPEVLWHGTAESTLEIILREGLRAMSRHHVHLSQDPVMARKVGSLHGRPVVLQVAAGALGQTGQLFYQSANGVWLTDIVPPEFLSLNPH